MCPFLCVSARPSRPNQKKRAADESIFSNLKQYGLEHLYIDALVGDTAREGMWREQTLFDAIITDRKIYSYIYMNVALLWDIKGFSQAYVF